MYVYIFGGESEGERPRHAGCLSNSRVKVLVARTQLRNGIPAFTTIYTPERCSDAKALVMGRNDQQSLQTHRQ